MTGVLECVLYGRSKRLAQNVLEPLGKSFEKNLNLHEFPKMASRVYSKQIDGHKAALNSNFSSSTFDLCTFPIVKHSSEGGEPRVLANSRNFSNAAEKKLASENSAAYKYNFFGLLKKQSLRLGQKELVLESKKHYAQFRSRDGLTPKQRKKLYLESCVQITICVGFCDRLSGEYFKAVYDKAISTFGKVIILVGDSVQWHTLQFDYPDLTEAALRQKAIENGEVWLKQHMQYIDQSKIGNKVEIVYWRDWEKKPGYQTMADRMTQLYDTDEAIRNAIDATINEFCDRRLEQKKYAHIPRTLMFEISKRYVIEECAVMVYKWSELGANYEISPANRSEAMDLIHQSLIANDHPNLLKALQVTFKSKKPQQQEQCVEDNKHNDEDAVFPVFSYSR